METNGKRLEKGLVQIADDARVPLQVARVGSMVGLSFGGSTIHNYRDAQSMDPARYARFFWSLLNRGIYIPPAPFETMFLSSAHGPDELDTTIEAAEKSLREAGPG
jgi:glutamate-1-semialdehyde 2,1-aminomutase